MLVAALFATSDACRGPGGPLAEIPIHGHTGGAISNGLIAVFCHHLVCQF